MAEQNSWLIQEFRLKNIDEIRNYFIEEVNQNELISKACTILNHIEYLLIYWMCFGFCF